MAMFVRYVEVKFGTQDCSEKEIEKKMNYIEEKFSKDASNNSFRTILRSYANEEGHSKIKFEFAGREGIPVGDVFKIFEDWQSIIKIDYSVFLRNMTISMI